MIGYSEMKATLTTALHSLTAVENALFSQYCTSWKKTRLTEKKITK